MSRFRRAEPGRAAAIATYAEFAVPWAFFRAGGEFLSSRPQHQPSAVPVDNTVWVGGLVGAVILLTDVISTNWQLVPNIVSMLVVDLALINLFILPGTDAGHVASVLYNELNGKPVAGKARLVLRFLHILGLVVIGIINTVPLCIFHRPRSGKSS